MRTRQIGSLEVSVVGVGCNQFGTRLDADGVEAVVDAALEVGVNFFDTAALYGKGASERLLGAALGSRRDEVVIATKYGADRVQGLQSTSDYVRSCVEASLERLGTDRIDLFQLHFPDLTSPIEETLAALAEMVQEGKVREVGCSNFTAVMIEDAEAASKSAGARFVSVQNHYSLLKREDETEGLAACQRLGLSYLPYYPLANGLLTGKYRRGEAPPSDTRLGRNPDRGRQLLTEDAFDTVESLEELALGQGRTLLELSIAWLLSRPALASVIAGVTRPEHVESNAAGADWELPDDLLAEIDEITGAS
jgi:aryl-alcohol dehydrogenase-like predicted oxidoreductase